MPRRKSAPRRRTPLELAGIFSIASLALACQEPPAGDGPAETPRDAAAASGSVEAAPATAAAEDPATAKTPSEGLAEEKEESAAPSAPPEFGVGGLGLQGTGRGGGGVGQGTIGLGNVGTIGKGGGGGVGSGYGRGSGAMIGRGAKRRSGAYAMKGPASSPVAIPSGGESFDKIDDEPFKAVADEPLSTFSVDVDTASYSMVRRYLRDGELPPIDAVRLEELVNYFDYDYPNPIGAHPFSVTTEVAAAPWAPKHRLLHVGLQGMPIDDAEVAPRNLVFLLDVSGSMNRPNALPLLKQGLGLLARQLRPQDKVAIVVYAGASGLVLPSTSGTDISTVLGALESLRAGGSTNGGAGIELAYRVAADNFIKGGINRVILATDGDFNVGVSSRAELERMIEAKRDSGVFLTVLGFGRGNTQDDIMETLADKGNGNYAYIDSVAEARKVLVREAGATLTTIAKDVKIQVEFNPLQVESYRLLGYANRRLAARDFNDDTKDAGEIGAGHSVTAIYEVVPAKGAAEPGVDALKYQTGRQPTGDAMTGELGTVKLRYKDPEGSKSKLLSEAVVDRSTPWAQASADFRWSAGVAAFAMLLRNSPHKGEADFALVRKLAESAVGGDPQGDRKGFLALVDAAASLRKTGGRGKGG